MKKITLLVALIAFNFNYAQDSCATAVAITAGTTSVGTINGTADNTCSWTTPGTFGEWYTFTASVDGVATITSNLPQNDGVTNSDDTRLSVFTGTCGALTCLTGSDDISDTNFLTTLTFEIVSGTTYYLLWDDRWSDLQFDFSFTETFVDCSTSSSYSYDFSSINPFIACYDIEDTNSDGTTWGYNNGNDFDGDAVNDPVGLIFPPDPTVAKDDWLFLPVFNGVANADYQITVIYNVFNNPVAGSESFELVALDSPSSTATMQNVIGSYSGITQAGAGVADLLPNAYTSSATYTPTTNGDFYFGIHLTTPQLTSAIFTLFNISVSETLSVNDFDQNVFTYNYNKNDKTLNIDSSNMAFSSIEVYSLLGQSVVSRPLSNSSESINVSELTDGIYLAKVNINGNSKTVKFIKN